MSPSFSRQDRVKKALIREVSDVIATDLKEPSLENKIISITDVDLSRDFSYGKVYLSILGQSASSREVVEALQRAAHKIQSTVGRRLKLKNTTKLSFHLDTSLERGSRVNDLLKQLSDERPLKESGEESDKNAEV